MLSPEAIEAYRRMTPDERLKLTIEATNAALPYLLMGPPEVVERRFQRINEENDARNRAMLEALAAAEGRREGD